MSSLCQRGSTCSVRHVPCVQGNLVQAFAKCLWHLVLLSIDYLRVILVAQFYIDCTGLKGLSLHFLTFSYFLQITIIMHKKAV